MKRIYDVECPGSVTYVNGALLSIEDVSDGLVRMITRRCVRGLGRWEDVADVVVVPANAVVLLSELGANAKLVKVEKEKMNRELSKVIPGCAENEWCCYAIYLDDAGPLMDADGKRYVVHSVYAPSNLQLRWVVEPSYWMPYEEKLLADAGLVAWKEKA